MVAKLDDIVAGAVADGGSDDEVLLDFSQATDFEPLEVGKSQPAIVKSVVQDTSKKGARMLVWEFVFTGGPNEDKTTKSWTVIEGKGTSSARQCIRALGFDPDDGKPFSLSKAVNRPLLLDIRVQKDSDPEDGYTEIARYRAPKAS